jgi:salicylate hydroxylase
LTLLGDAAHATLPFLAQGAAMALEDAAALVEPLNAGLERGTLAQAIGARQQRTTRLHLATLATGRAYHASGIARSLRNAALMTINDDLFWQRTAWIYNG